MHHDDCLALPIHGQIRPNPDLNALSFSPVRQAATPLTDAAPVLLLTKDLFTYNKLAGPPP